MQFVKSVSCERGTLASPAMGHWGTCPLNFQQFIFGTLLWSCIKYHINFLCQISSGFCLPQLLKIKLIIFFILLKTNDPGYKTRADREKGVSFYWNTVYSYFHFMCRSQVPCRFCRSSRLILATPLNRHGAPSAIHLVVASTSTADAASAVVQYSVLSTQYRTGPVHAATCMRCIAMPTDHYHVDTSLIEPVRSLCSVLSS